MKFLYILYVDLQKQENKVYASDSISCYLIFKQNSGPGRFPVRKSMKSCVLRTVLPFIDKELKIQKKKPHNIALSLQEDNFFF